MADDETSGEVVGAVAGAMDSSGAPGPSSDAQLCGEPVDPASVGEVRERVQRDRSVEYDLATLVIGSMCHCDDPDECYDHWQFYVHAEMSDDAEHVRRECELTKAHMDEILRRVQGATDV